MVIRPDANLATRHFIPVKGIYIETPGGFVVPFRNSSNSPPVAKLMIIWPRV